LYIDREYQMKFKYLIFKLVIITLFYHSFIHADVLNDYNPYNVNIPDNGPSVNSDLNLSGAANGAMITNVKVYYEIRHTYPGDLDVWLTTYYDNSWHDHWLYHTGDLGSSDDIVETRDNIYTWNNASPNQIWYLVVRDRVTSDVGYIDFFELWITYEVNSAPNNPSNPDPPDGAPEISITTNIDWSCTDPDGDNIYYTVYFEENNSSPDVIIMDDLTGSNADPGTLDYDSHYYWQVLADDHEGGVTTGSVWDFYTIPNPNGNLQVTVENVGGSPIPGAIVKKYDADWNVEQQITNDNGIATWNSITPGDYHLEAYYTGTFLGEEYWASGDVTVSAGSTAEYTLLREYPFIEDVVFTNYETGTILVSNSEIESGTTISAEVTVRNNVAANLGVTVRMILDQSQSTPYDSDMTSQETTILDGGIATYELTYTPNQVGTWYRAFEVKTRLANNNIWTTDAWPWSQVFDVFGIPNVDLISIDFNNSLYRRNEIITATLELHNNDNIDLYDLHLLIDFKDPTGNFNTEYTSDSFSIPANTTYNTISMNLWQVPYDAISGAYEPRIKLVNSNGLQLITYITGENPQIPIIPIGNFPILNNIIVRSQEHFDANNVGSVYPVLFEFAVRGLMSISLSLKLDDGDGIWDALSPVPGMVLYNSSIATPTAQNPLLYDLYSEAQSVAQSLEMNVNPWIPTFFDHAQSRFDHPGWILTNDPPSAPNQDFVDAYLYEVRQYEGSLINEVVSPQYESPVRVTLDHFRFTNGQHGVEGINSITTFTQSVKDSLPTGTQLAGYVWLPSDTWWSGQDYSSLNPYLDIFSPMFYWQDGQINSNEEIYYSAPNYIISKISEIRDVLGSTTTQAKVMPTLSITTKVKYSDGIIQNLDPYEWKKTQLNVLGKLADENLVGYDLFFHGKWLWPVYQDDTGQGQWIDWAQYLAELALDNGSLRITISPQGAIDAGAQWRRIGEQTWRNSDYTESGISIGTYVVEFRDVSDWLTPPNQTVVIARNQTTFFSGNYEPIPRINTNISSISVLEGESASFNVRLSQQPSSNTTVITTRYSGDTDINVSSGSSLEFTTSNWDTYQIVTLSAAEDSDTENGVAIIRCSAAGLDSLEISVMEQDNDGSVTFEHYRIPIDADSLLFLSDLAISDLNTDNYDEILVLLQGEENDDIFGELVVYSWNGSEFSRIWNSIRYFGYPYGFQLIDINNDQLIDVLVSFGGVGGNLRYFRNDGNGFQDEGSIINYTPDDMFIAHDLDNDGDVDLAVGSPYANGGNIRLYQQDNSIGSYLYVGDILGTPGKNMLKLINYDNDGSFDILSGELYTGDVYIFKNNGNFTFTEQYFTSFGTRIFSLETSDFDSDDDDDFIVAEAWSSIHFYENDNGNIIERYESSAIGSCFNTVQVDINNDGHSDIIAATFAGEVYLYTNLTGFNFQERLGDISTNSNYGLAVGDIDNDGIYDIAFGKDTIEIILNAPAIFDLYLTSEFSEPENIPLKYSLRQNYPNPFNPFTTIQYDLPNRSDIQITIYDLMGRKVTTLISETQGAGFKSVKWDATNVTSGMYFYQIKAGEFVQTKKMILLK